MTSIRLRKKVLYRALGLFAVLVVLSVAGFAYMVSQAKPAPSAPRLYAGVRHGVLNAEQAIGVNLDSGDRLQLSAGDPYLGNPEAELTIVEFSDFQCPYCERAHQALDALRQTPWFENGHVAIVFKHLPLTSIHPLAQQAAEAAECAKQQEAFWPYHDRLFATGNLQTSDLRAHASSLGLDTEAFAQCLANGGGSAKVATDLEAARRAGGEGTPYFVVTDGEQAWPISGALSREEWEQVFTQLLPNALPEEA